jgi:hypothetical protein
MEAKPPKVTSKALQRDASLKTHVPRQAIASKDNAYAQKEPLLGRIDVLSHTILNACRLGFLEGVDSHLTTLAAGPAA